MWNRNIIRHRRLQKVNRTKIHLASSPANKIIDPGGYCEYMRSKGKQITSENISLSSKSNDHKKKKSKKKENVFNTHELKL